MPRRPPSSNLSAKRVKLVVAYDGTDFRGWASQRDQRTVCSTLTEAVRQISGEDCEIIGASRTDSGAHARGQVCHFDCEAAVPPHSWRVALNRRLETDLAVVRSEHVANDFHSRFCARHRWYRYTILDGTKDPIRGRFAHWTPRPLDHERMQAAARILVGRHDFIAFSHLVSEDRNTVRTLYRVDVKRVRDAVNIDVVGTAFVRGMMRRIAGSLWEIGRDRRDLESLQALLRERDKTRIDWPPVLPAAGLTLMQVSYGRHPKDHRLSDELDRNEADNRDE